MKALTQNKKTMTTKDDNEVREIARMQQLIDGYEAFILALAIMTRSDHDIDYPLFTDTNLDKMMNRLWRWVKEHKSESKEQQQTEKG